MFCYVIYSTWAAKEGPKRDSYNISDNPQFRLEIRANQPAAVWILLTRHITDKVRTSVSLCLFVIVHGTWIDYVRSSLLFARIKKLPEPPPPQKKSVSLFIFESQDLYFG